MLNAFHMKYASEQQRTEPRKQKIYLNKHENLLFILLLSNLRQVVPDVRNNKKVLFEIPFENPL